MTICKLRFNQKLLHSKIKNETQRELIFCSPQSRLSCTQNMKEWSTQKIFNVSYCYYYFRCTRRTDGRTGGGVSRRDKLYKTSRWFNLGWSHAKTLGGFRLETQRQQTRLGWIFSFFSDDQKKIFLFKTKKSWNSFERILSPWKRQK